MDKRELLTIAARIFLAKKSFWHYCKLTIPTFYTEDKAYLKRFCKDLEDFYYSKDTILVINLPPRHGKSLTLTLFCQWVFGINIHEHIMTSSYNSNLSTNFSKQVRDKIQEIKSDANKVIYSDIFPDTQIKKGSGRKDFWELEGSYSNYIATSPGGLATGFGATIQIFDDIIKNYYEACNANIKESHWDWFTGTMQSRIEDGNYKQIFVMTRWASDDLSGKIIDLCKRSNIPYRHINYSLTQPDGSILCESVLSRERIRILKESLPEDVFQANYEQKPIDVKNRLYTRFNFYINEEDKKNYNEEELKQLQVVNPKYFETIGAYCDTADTGEDFLTLIIFGVYKEKIYLLDVLYTQAAMETTEILCADMLDKTKTQYCKIESNNGGRGFARNVYRILQENYDNELVTIETFTQSLNKIARILSESGNVMKYVYYPNEWKYDKEHNEFMQHLTRYGRVGKNDHDDAEDCLTGVVEMCRDSGYIMQEI